MELDLGSLDIEGLLADSGDIEEAKYTCRRAVFIGKKQNIQVDLLITESIGLAQMLNKDLDEFTSYYYFLLPSGLEIKNEALLAELEAEDEEVRLTMDEIKAYEARDFNTAWIQSLLANVKREESTA